MKEHGNVRVVLVRPRDPRNVGAACRAMKCMGITSLAIVAGGLLDPAQARTLAHGAEDVLEAAVVHPDLDSAISDAVLVAGTTRRRGKNRKYFTLFPEQLAQRVAEARGTVAVVFGNEETGLTDEELSRCTLAVTIPASPAQGSLNLSHAVQVVCYEIFRARARGTLTPFTPIPAREVDALAGLVVGSLRTIGFFHLVTPDSMRVFFRDILGRAGLSVNEARRMGVVFRKIAGLLAGKGIDPGDDPP